MWKRSISVILGAVLLLGSVSIGAEEFPGEFDSDSADGSVVYTVSDDVELLSISSVSLPTQFPFVIDPYEIEENGTVYSLPFPIQNNGGETVRVDVTEAFCYRAGDDVHILQRPVDTSQTLPDKEIQIILRSSRGEEIVLTAQPQEGMSFILEAGEAVVLEITGSANLPSKQEWHTGDVSVVMRFHLELCPF